MTLRPTQLVAYLSLAWAGVALLSLIGWNPLGVVWLVGTPMLLYVPGALTLRAARVRLSDSTVHAVLSVGVSIVLLMVWFALANTVLPPLGVQRPLDTLPAVLTATVLLAALIALVYPTLTPITLSLPHYLIASSRRDAVYLGVGALLAFAAALGAFLQNNGGENTLSMMVLAFLALLFLLLAYDVKRLAPGAVAGVLYLGGLAVLLMTSLRGWFITGHDIQREFFVFQLAADAGRWSMAAYVDAYNACLSITVLPTVLAHVLNVPDAYVFKLLIQLVFALTVPLVFALARRVVTVRRAALAAMLYVAFPTFLQDMPFLIRQEVAFLCYGLLLYVLFTDDLPHRARGVLAIALGIGVMLSHYSTTYLVVAILGLTYVLTPLARRVLGSIAPDTTGVTVEAVERRITLTLLVSLVVATFIWTSVITGTDKHLREVTRDVWSAIAGEGEDIRSLDVRLLFSFGRPRQVMGIEEYVRDVVVPRRESSPDEFYPVSTFAAYPLVTVPTTELPVTPRGSLIKLGPFELGEVLLVIGQVLVKLLQAAVVAGMLYVLVRGRTLHTTVSAEAYMLAASAIVFIGLCVLVPVLSIEYGVLRAFLQSLYLLAPFMVLGVLAVIHVCSWAIRAVLVGVRGGTASSDRDEGTGDGTAAVLVALFFLYASGFVSQLVGGNVPAIHLNSVGDDYKQHVTQASEYAAIQWLKGELDRAHDETGKYPLVQSDRFGEMKLRAYLSSRVGGDIFPGSVHKDAYVFVTPAIQYSGTAVVHHEGTAIKYAYPLAFLEEQKSLVYSNGDVRIYK